MQTSSGLRADDQLTGGGHVAGLEGKLREHYGSTFALAVSSATNGLLALAIAMRMKRAAFVAPPLSWGGTVAPFLMLGNRPQWADVDPVTLTLDPASVRRAITPRTKAIVGVDLHGTPSDDRELRAIADEHGLFYISDAAQSFGATRDGRPASSLADATVLSFGPGKPLDCGEGGAIVTSNTALYETLLRTSQHPSRQGLELGFQQATEFGPLNARIHPGAAAAACVGFEDALKRLLAKQKSYLYAVDVINQTGFAEEIPFRGLGITPSFTRLTAAWKDAPHEEKFVAALGRSGIIARCSKPSFMQPLYTQPAFLSEWPKWRGTGCPVAEDQARRRFTIDLNQCGNSCRRQRPAPPAHLYRNGGPVILESGIN